MSEQRLVTLLPNQRNKKRERLWKSNCHVLLSKVRSLNFSDSVVGGKEICTFSRFQCYLYQKQFQWLCVNLHSTALHALDLKLNHSKKEQIVLKTSDLLHKTPGVINLSSIYPTSWMHYCDTQMKALHTRALNKQLDTCVYLRQVKVAVESMEVKWQRLQLLSFN